MNPKLYNKKHSFSSFKNIKMKHFFNIPRRFLLFVGTSSSIEKPVKGFSKMSYSINQKHGKGDITRIVSATFLGGR